MRENSNRSVVVKEGFVREAGVRFSTGAHSKN